MLDKWLEGLKVSGKPDEWEVKELLRERGICVPDGILLKPEEEIRIPEIRFLLL